MFVAHHDAAQRRPDLPARARPALVADTFPGWYARQTTSPQMMRLVAAGPALAGLGALPPAPCCKLGRRAAGARLPRSPSATSPPARSSPAPTTTSPPSPCCSSSRGCCATSRRAACACCSSPPARRSRSWRACAAFVPATPPRSPASARASSCSSTLGSPELILLEGEGMIRMRDYDARACATCSPRAAQRRRRTRCAAGCARLRHRRAVGAAARATRPRMLASCDEYKMPANYHSQRDIPRNVDFETVAAGARVAARRRSARAASRARADRVLAGARSRPRSAPPRAAASSAPSSRPGRTPELARELVAAHERLGRLACGGRAPGRASSRASSRWAAIAGSALLPARGEAVGDGEDGDVGGVGRRSRSGSARPRGATSGRSWTRKPSRRWWRVSAAT